jgi:UDP-glucose 4-epimerase
MKVLVLGGSGFIGYHLVKALQENGMEPHVADIRAPQGKDVPYTIADLSSLSKNDPLFRGAEAVFHLAWTTLPKTSSDSPEHDIVSNIPMSLNILNACLHNGVRKLIFVSSGGTVYGIPKTVPISEDHPLEPICSYGITKLTVEKYLGLYRHHYGLDYVVVRPSNPYGEFQNPNGQQGAVAVFLGRLARGVAIDIWGDGSVVRDFLYAGDLADAMVRCIRYTPPESGERIFNIGNGRGMSLKELVDIMAQITGREPVINYRESRALDVPSNVLDISRAKQRLGWSPKVEIVSGIGQTWQWIRESGYGR